MRRKRINVHTVGSKMNPISKEEIKTLSLLLDKFVGSMEEDDSCLSYNAYIGDAEQVSEITDGEYLDVRAARVVVKKVLQCTM